MTLDHEATKARLIKAQADLEIKQFKQLMETTAYERIAVHREDGFGVGERGAELERSSSSQQLALHRILDL